MQLPCEVSIRSLTSRSKRRKRKQLESEAPEAPEAPEDRLRVFGSLDSQGLYLAGTALGRPPGDGSAVLPTTGVDQRGADIEKRRPDT